MVSGEDYPVACSMKVLKWLMKRTKEEIKARGLASHALVPPVDHCALFVATHDGSGSAAEVLEAISSAEHGHKVMNKIYVRTDFDFTQVEHIEFSKPEPCCPQIKRGHLYTFLILKLTRISTPMVLPYIYTNKIKNTLMEWCFFNSSLSGSVHSIQSKYSSPLPPLSELAPGRLPTATSFPTLKDSKKSTTKRRSKHRKRRFSPAPLLQQGLHQSVSAETLLPPLTPYVAPRDIALHGGWRKPKIYEPKLWYKSANVQQIGSSQIYKVR